jgi:hypothetical protein
MKHEQVLIPIFYSKMFLFSVERFRIEYTIDDETNNEYFIRLLYSHIISIWKKEISSRLIEWWTGDNLINLKKVWFEYSAISKINVQH